MTKAEVVNAIASQTDVNKEDTLKIVEAFMETVKDTMNEGKNVYLRGFGTFEIKHRAEKTARNISKNTTVIIPAHNIPSFKPSKSFVEDVKRGNS
jgi:DNA-binding protein HU-beta